jgi:hypothetical protein
VSAVTRNLAVDNASHISDADIFDSASQFFNHQNKINWLIFFAFPSSLETGADFVSAKNGMALV